MYFLFGVKNLAENLWPPKAKVIFLWKIGLVGLAGDSSNWPSQNDPWLGWPVSTSLVMTGYWNIGNFDRHWYHWPSPGPEKNAKICACETWTIFSEWKNWGASSSSWGYPHSWFISYKKSANPNLIAGWWLGVPGMTKRTPPIFLGDMGRSSPNIWGTSPEVAWLLSGESSSKWTGLFALPCLILGGYDTYLNVSDLLGPQKVLETYEFVCKQATPFYPMVHDCQQK